MSTLHTITTFSRPFYHILSPPPPYCVIQYHYPCMPCSASIFTGQANKEKTTMHFKAPLTDDKYYISGLFVHCLLSPYPFSKHLRQRNATTGFQQPQNLSTLNIILCVPFHIFLKLPIDWLVPILSTSHPPPFFPTCRVNPEPISNRWPISVPGKAPRCDRPTGSPSSVTDPPYPVPGCHNRGWAGTGWGCRTGPASTRAPSNRCHVINLNTRSPQLQGTNQELRYEYYIVLL